MTSWGTNPYYAYVNFSVGEYNLTQLPPNHLVSFNYERVTDSSLGTANKFTLVVLDETGLELEEAIAKGLEDCKFQYGYTNGVQSPLYSGRITFYDFEFVGGGAVLTIEGVSTGMSAFTTPKTITYSSSTIDEIVTAIALEEGWSIGKIEKCAPVADGDNTNKVFSRTNQDAVTFIVSELIPYAKSANTGESGYTFYFKDVNGTSEVYFCTPNWRGEGDDKIKEYDFDIFSSNNGSVISFKPEYSGILAATLGSGTVDAQSIDALKNEMFRVVVNKDTNSNRAVLGTKNIDTSNYKSVVATSSSTVDELMNISANLWYRNASQSYPATLIVVGDPTIEPQTYISVLAMLRNGLPHHSSGIYLATTIVDDISGASFTSTISMFRNGLNIGVDDSGGVSVTSVGTSVGSTNSTVVDGSTEGSTGSGAYGYPFSGKFTITSVFGPRRSQTTTNGNSSSSNHGGMDLVGTDSTEVISIADGEVTDIINSGSSGYGLHVVMKTAQGDIVYYGHLNSVSCSKGSIVKGASIGIMGSTGNVTGPHLHLEVRHSGDRVDPAPLLGLKNPSVNQVVGG